MISDKAKLLCLVVVTLTLSGCGSSSGDSSDIADPLIIDDAINADDPTTAEVTVSMEATDSIATPVPSVNSLEMEAFIKNPLAAAVPAELRDGLPSSTTSSYIVNPLMN